jgi:hypothetical protein
LRMVEKSAHRVAQNRLAGKPTILLGRTAAHPNSPPAGDDQGDTITHGPTGT